MSSDLDFSFTPLSPQPPIVPRRRPRSFALIAVLVAGISVVGGLLVVSRLSEDEAQRSAAAAAAQALLVAENEQAYRTAAWCVVDKASEAYLLLGTAYLSGDPSQVTLANAAIPTAWAVFAAIDWRALSEPARYAGLITEVTAPLQTIAPISQSGSIDEQDVSALLVSVLDGRYIDAIDELQATLTIRGLERPAESCVGIPAPYDR